MQNWRYYSIKIHVKYKKNLTQAESLEIAHSIISIRLKALGIIQKQGNWVSYGLKLRDLERPGIFSRVNNCSNGKNGKVFCIVSLLMMKSGYITTTQSEESNGVSPAMH